MIETLQDLSISREDAHKKIKSLIPQAENE